MSKTEQYLKLIDEAGGAKMQIDTWHNKKEKIGLHLNGINIDNTEKMPMLTLYQANKLKKYADYADNHIVYINYVFKSRKEAP